MLITYGITFVELCLIALFVSVFRDTRLGPKYYFGIPLSLKVDHTILEHAAFTLLGSLLHPIVPIAYYFGKEAADSVGPESCIGFGKCKQGFGVGDFLAPLLISLTLWIGDSFSLLRYFY